LSGGEFPAAKVAEIREGRFGSRHFRNLEKTRSDRGRVEPHFCIANDSVYKFCIGRAAAADRPDGLAGSRGRWRILWDAGRAGRMARAKFGGGSPPRIGVRTYLVEMPAAAGVPISDCRMIRSSSGRRPAGRIARAPRLGVSCWDTYSGLPDRCWYGSIGYASIVVRIAGMYGVGPIGMPDCIGPGMYGELFRSPVGSWFVCVCGDIAEIGDKPAAGLSPKLTINVYHQ